MTLLIMICDFCTLRDPPLVSTATTMQWDLPRLDHDQFLSHACIWLFVQYPFRDHGVVELMPVFSSNLPTSDAAAAVRNFLQSLQGDTAFQNQPGPQGQLYTTLTDLLSTANTIPVIESADEDFVDKLLLLLPPVLLLISQEAIDIPTTEPTPESAEAALEALSLDQKKEILRKVLRSPQFTQSTGSLTQAIRDGGLPMISEALSLPVANKGFVKAGSGVPAGGGDAVEAFVKGVKEDVEKTTKGGEREDGMETE